MDMSEIEARIKAIGTEAEKEGADLDALEEEMRTLKEQREKIIKEAEQRKKLMEDVEENASKIKTFEEEKEKMEENRTYGVESAEYRSAWLKNLQGKALNDEEQRAYASTDANNAVPTQVADKFFEKMKALAPMLNEITLMRVAGNLKFIAQGTRTAAGKHTENATASPAGDTIVQVVLGAFEFMKVIKISKAAVNQSIDAFEGWLVEMLSKDIAIAIDDYIINDASNGIEAMTFTTNTNQIVDTAATNKAYKYEDLIKLAGILPAGYDAEAKFLVNKATLWNDIRGIVDSQGRPIFDPEDKTLLGYPVLVDDNVTTVGKHVILGAFNNVVGNLSEGVNVERNDSAAFADGAIMFRGYAAFDSKVANEEAIVRLVSTT